MAGVAVVVGAGPGIGAAMAVRFAAAGYVTVGFARSQPSLDALACAAQQAGVRVEGRAVDAGDHAALTAALGDVAADHGPVTAAVYNAADLRRARTKELDAARFAASLGVSVVGAQALIQAVRAPMAAAGGGTILLTGGGFALAPSPVFGPLSVGKAALRALALTAARDLAKEGIHLATVTIKGFVAPEGATFTPAEVADVMWALHEQPKAAWDVERELG